MIISEGIYSNGVLRCGELTIHTTSYLQEMIQGFATIYEGKRKVFEGYFKNSKRDGYGIQYNKNQEIEYQGEYRNDLFDGWGRTNNYRGQFHKGIYDGFGVLVSQQNYYEGYFQLGRKQGLGIQLKGTSLQLPKVIPNIQEFLQQIIAKNLAPMKDYCLDKMYKGEFMGDLPHGCGKQWRNDGSWYNGQFANGLFHGDGAFQDATKNNQVAMTFFKGGKIYKD